MFLTRLLLKFSFFSLVSHVFSLTSDIDQLKDHFFDNLIEETRKIAALQLTEDVKQIINLKIDGFLDIISPSGAVRTQRDTNDLLLNEKSELEHKNGSVY